MDSLASSSASIGGRSTASGLLSCVLRRLLSPLFSPPLPASSVAPSSLSSPAFSPSRSRSASPLRPDEEAPSASASPSDSASAVAPFLTEDRRNKILEELSRRCKEPPLLTVQESCAEEASCVRVFWSAFLTAKDGGTPGDTEDQENLSATHRDAPFSVQLLLSVFDSQLREIQARLAEHSGEERREEMLPRPAASPGCEAAGCPSLEESLDQGPANGDGPGEDELVRDEAALLLLRRRCLQWMGMWRVATHAFSPSGRRQLRVFVDRERRKRDDPPAGRSLLSGRNRETGSSPRAPSAARSAAEPQREEKPEDPVAAAVPQGRASRQPSPEKRRNGDAAGGSEREETSEGRPSRRAQRASRGKAKTFYVVQTGGGAGVLRQSTLTLHNFVKVQQVGQGAYGDVWMAEDVKNRRRVAMKKMKIMAPPPGGAVPANPNPLPAAGLAARDGNAKKQERDEKPRGEKNAQGGVAAVAAACQQMNNAGEEREGFPRTAIREICLLNELANCKHTVELLAVVHSKPRLKDRHHRGSVWMVFEYLPFDLLGFLDAIRDSKERREKYTRPQTWLSIGEIKGILLQLFTALHHCHRRNVVHRDLKSANLLMDADGTVKLADFGLARKFTKFVARQPELLTRALEEKSRETLHVLPFAVEKNEKHPSPGNVTATNPSESSSPSSPPSGCSVSGFLPGEALAESEKPVLTNRVITLWYRPPELLLGSEAYDGSVDMWSAGCIMAELVCGMPLFAADREAALLRQIVEKIGPPSESDLASLKALCPQHFRNQSGRGEAFARDSVFDGSGVDRSLEIQRLFKYRNQIGDEGWDLLRQLLAWNPAKRITARAALQHRWFSTHPLPRRVEKRANLHAAHSYVSKHAQRRGGREPRQVGAAHAKKGPGKEGSAAADDIRCERVSVEEARVAAWTRNLERKAARLEALRHLYCERQKLDQRRRDSLSPTPPVASVSGVSTQETASSGSSAEPPGAARLSLPLSASLAHPPGAAEQPALSHPPSSVEGAPASFAASSDLFPRKEREAFTQMRRDERGDNPWHAEEPGDDREKEGEERREDEKQDSVPPSFVSPPPVSTHFSPGSWNEHTEQDRVDRRHYGREEREGRRGRDSAFGDSGVHAPSHKGGFRGRCLREIGDEERGREGERRGASGASARRSPRGSEERERDVYASWRAGEKARGREAGERSGGRRDEERNERGVSPSSRFHRHSRRGHDASGHASFSSGHLGKDPPQRSLASIAEASAHASPGGSVSDMTNSDEETGKRRGGESLCATSRGRKEGGREGKWWSPRESRARDDRWPEAWDRRSRDRGAETDYPLPSSDSSHSRRKWEEKSRRSSPSLSVSPEHRGAGGAGFAFRRGRDEPDSAGESRRVRKRGREEGDERADRAHRGKRGVHARDAAETDARGCETGREADEFGSGAQLSPGSLALLFPAHEALGLEGDGSEKAADGASHLSAVAKKQEERRRKAFDLFKRAAQSNAPCSSGGRGVPAHADGVSEKAEKHAHEKAEAGAAGAAPWQEQAARPEGSEDGICDASGTGAEGRREAVRDEGARTGKKEGKGSEDKSKQLGYRRGREDWRDNGGKTERERPEPRDGEKAFGGRHRDSLESNRSPRAQEDLKRMSLPSVESQLSSPDALAALAVGVGARGEEGDLLSCGAYREKDERDRGLHSRDAQKAREREHEELRGRPRASPESRHAGSTRHHERDSGQPDRRQEREDASFPGRSTAFSSHSVSPFSPPHEDEVRGGRDGERKRTYPSFASSSVSKEGRPPPFALGSSGRGDARAAFQASPLGFARQDAQPRLGPREEEERRRRGVEKGDTAALDRWSHGKSREWSPAEKARRERGSDFRRPHTERGSLGRDDRASCHRKDRRRDHGKEEKRSRGREDSAEGRDARDHRERDMRGGVYCDDSHRRRGEEKERRKGRDGKRRRMSDAEGKTGDGRDVAFRS
uniref:Cyclin-dependent kinase 2 homolog n=1 Tax=Neospora caninum (strain Liverpool) TaxID=572307 RepID=A0A0F7UQW6_NEOCL|nr:TPA: CMGC kinase, putative [Neospora caninum Liverpool]